MNVLNLYRQLGHQDTRAASTKGGEHVGPCPGCGGRDRFHIWPDQHNGEGSYWCRQCGAPGPGKRADAVQFRIDFMGEDFKTAAAACGRDPVEPKARTPRRPFQRPAARPAPAHTPVENGPPAEAWRKKAGRLVVRAHTWLDQDEAAAPHREWLAARGIDVTLLRFFKLGWNPGDRGRDLFRPRESWGLPTEMKGDRPKKLWIPRGLIVPLVVGDDVWRIRIRRSEDEGPRYYVLPGSSMRQLTVAPAGALAAVVVETELDAMMLVGQRPVPDVACIALGSSSAHPDAEAHRVLSKAWRILVALDFDAAGAKAWERWRDTYPKAVRWPVPKGKDPGEAYQAGVDLRAWIAAGLPAAMTIGASSFGLPKKGGRADDTDGAKDGGRGEDAAADGVPAVEAQQEAGEDPPGAVGPVDFAAGRYPRSVIELARLLRAHPIRVENSAKRLGLDYPLGWHNAAVLARVSELVFRDADVGAFLDARPEDVVTGRNVLFQQRGRGGQR